MVGSLVCSYSGLFVLSSRKMCCFALCICCDAGGIVSQSMLCTGVGNLIMVSGYIFQPLCRDVELDLSKMKKKRESYKAGYDRVTEEREGWCSDPHVPPCAGYVILPP